MTKLDISVDTLPGATISVVCYLVLRAGKMWNSDYVLKQVGLFSCPIVRQRYLLTDTSEIKSFCYSFDAFKLKFLKY